MKLNHIEFLNKLTSKLSGLGVSLEDATLDHIAFYVASSEEYDDLRGEFLKLGSLEKEPLVSGRRVGVFKLHKPLIYEGQGIKAIELIEPKEGQVVESSGLEHAEYILPVTLEEFVEKYPNVNWDKSRMNREEFPMLKLRLTESIQVKFPRNPILET